MSSQEVRDVGPAPTAGPEPAPRSSSRKLDPWESQQIFREMAVSLLGRGTLSSRRRRMLVQYAAALGINAVLAGRLLEQARAEHARRVAAAVASLRFVPVPVQRPKSLPRWTWGLALALGGLLLNVLMLLWAGGS